jgi:hypothetical protein
MVVPYHMYMYHVGISPQHLGNNGVETTCPDEMDIGATAEGSVNPKDAMTWPLEGVTRYPVEGEVYSVMVSSVSGCTQRC